MTSSLLLALACSPTAAAKLLRGSVAAANGTVPQLPAANYAGIGYDILQGNPLADGLDKGCRAAVLDAASFAQGLKTPDGKWAIPDNTEAVMASACDIQSGGSQRLVTGETSLGTTSQNDVSVGGEAWKVVAFKASAGFKKTTSDVTASSDDTVVFYSRGTIELYKLNVETALATPSPNFAAAVGALPTDADGRIKSTFAAGAGFEYCLGVDAATAYDDQGTGLIYLACDQADPKAIQWQLNVEAPWASGGARADAWNCDAADSVGDERTRWTMDGSALKSAQSGYCLEVNPGLSRVYPDAWKCADVAKMADKRASWTVTDAAAFSTTGSTLVTGWEGWCLYGAEAFDGKNGAAVAVAPCDRADVAASASWKRVGTSIVNVKSGYCLEINPSDAYNQPDGFALDTWDCGAATSENDNRTSWTVAGDGTVVSGYAKAAASLCLEPREGGDVMRAYDALVETFGTHYVSSTTLGAKYGLLQEATSDSAFHFQGQGHTWSAGAQASFKGVAVGADHMSSDEQALSDAWTASLKSSSSFFVGSDPVAAMQNDLDGWKAKIATNPMPDTQISNKRTLLAKALGAWCATVDASKEACAAYAADRGSDLTSCPEDASGNECSGHGSCMSDNTCACDPNYGGTACDAKCGSVTFYGSDVDSYGCGAENGSVSQCTQLSADVVCTKLDWEFGGATEWHDAEADHCITPIEGPKQCNKKDCSGWDSFWGCNSWDCHAFTSITCAYPSTCSSA
ncbi:hypothetical protein JL722_9351 [Aureococcus anophagefferens]|nr:hypothetical protein JL722_9351 [Aureococcus anophagefferens]